MTQSIVTQAFRLFVETLPLATTCIETESAKWHDLYSKECEMFGLMMKFTPEQGDEYRKMVHDFLQEDPDAGQDWDEICQEWNPIEEELQWEYMNGEYPED